MEVGSGCEEHCLQDINEKAAIEILAKDGWGGR